MKELIGDYGQNNICFKTGKQMLSKREAGEKINALKKHNTYNRLGKGNDKPKRAYYCESCGSYHVTHYGNVYKKKKPLKEIYR